MFAVYSDLWPRIRAHDLWSDQWKSSHCIIISQQQLGARSLLWLKFRHDLQFVRIGGMHGRVAADLHGTIVLPVFVRLEVSAQGFECRDGQVIILHQVRQIRQTTKLTFNCFQPSLHLCPRLTLHLCSALCPPKKILQLIPDTFARRHDLSEHYCWVAFKIDRALMHAWYEPALFNNFVAFDIPHSALEIDIACLQFNRVQRTLLPLQSRLQQQDVLQEF